MRKLLSTDPKDYIEKTSTKKEMKKSLEIATK